MFMKKELKKTMIACSRQEQANQVYEYLVNQLGINAAVSHAKSDSDSQLFNDFEAGKYDILIVVNRGRLGYSDDNLYNMIDMTGTKTPDLIYQMFARVVRGNKSQQKFFIKIAPTGAGMMDLTDINTRMALSLLFEIVVSTFNGKNFNGMFIPVIKKQKTEKYQRIFFSKRPEKTNNK
jgi:superfamily II DNA or RNA helicase